ncbi:MAG: ISNCY family transposase [Chloroflexota bacterium]
MEGMVTLSKKEQTRLRVLNEVEKGVISGTQAAVLIGVSLRQLKRLMAAYRGKGAAGLAHGNRGRKPPNMICDEVRRSVVELASTRYAGFNQRHFQEMLAEREGIGVSRSFVRYILLGAGIRSPRRRRPPKHRSRRERYAQEGMLLQTDGSPHDWLEGRGPAMSLLGAIDDATGKVPYAIFREQEDTAGYFMLLREVVVRHGIPLAVYHDRHSIFRVTRDKVPSLAEQLEGKQPITQFGRLLAELGIESIAALSPQAKGRIERLWGTFQDRLVSEMRLAGITSITEANCFLPGFLERFNIRFAVISEVPGSAYRSIGDDFTPEAVFSFKHSRTVGLDNVVRFQGCRLQILPSFERLSYARCAVEVHETLNGATKVYYRGRYLDICPAPPEATLARQTVHVSEAKPQLQTHTARPGADHPWRRRLLPVRN